MREREEEVRGEGEVRGTYSGEHVSGHVGNKRRELQSPGHKAVHPARWTHQNTLTIHDVVDVAHKVTQYK